MKLRIDDYPLEYEESISFIALLDNCVTIRECYLFETQQASQTKCVRSQDAKQEHSLIRELRPVLLVRSPITLQKT
jgi:hypothetical protein